jgi:hypothetical protein
MANASYSYPITPEAIYGVKWREMIPAGYKIESFRPWWAWEIVLSNTGSALTTRSKGPANEPRIILREKSKPRRFVVEQAPHSPATDTYNSEGYMSYVFDPATRKTIPVKVIRELDGNEPNTEEITCESWRRL